VLNTRSADLTHQLAERLFNLLNAQGGITPLTPLFANSHAAPIEDIPMSAAVEQAIREVLIDQLADFAIFASDSRPRSPDRSSSIGEPARAPQHHPVSTCRSLSRRSQERR